MTARPCSFPDGARLALLDATGRLEGADLERWDAHLATCAACAEVAALAAPMDAALAAEAARTAAPPTRRRRARLLVGVALATAASVVAAALLGSRTDSAPAGSPARTAGIDEASRLIELGRREEARVLLDRLLAESRDPRALFLAGHVRLNTGHPELAVPLFREALGRVPSVGKSRAPDAPFDRGYVAGHLAQALLATAHGAEHDAEVEGLVRDEMTGTGVDASVNRAYIWADLAARRAFSRLDVAGGVDALGRAERENLVHREESARAGHADLDCHYVLHARFAFAEGVHADSEGGRRAAARIRAEKTLTAAAARATTQAARDSYLADGLEFEAVAELLAARRGDPADLDLARRRLEDALALRAAARNPEGLAHVHARLAWLDLLAGRPSAALATCLQAEQEATTSGAPESLVDARLLRAQAFLALGRRPDARAALAAARAVTGASLDARRTLGVASIEALAADDEADRRRALGVLAAAIESPLADVRRVAARVLAAIETGGTVGVGAIDLGYDPHP